MANHRDNYMNAERGFRSRSNVHISETVGTFAQLSDWRACAPGLARERRQAACAPRSGHVR